MLVHIALDGASTTAFEGIAPLAEPICFENSPAATISEHSISSNISCSTDTGNSGAESWSEQPH